MQDEIVVAGPRVKRAIIFAVVAFFFAVSILKVLDTQRPLGGLIAVFLFIGPFLFAAAIKCIRNPPLLRASISGLLFGRGRVIEWKDVKIIHERDVNTGIMVFDFSSGRLKYQLPIEVWFPLENLIRRRVNAGHVEIDTRFSTVANVTVLVARLVSMRTRVVGSRDGVTLGDAAELPTARALNP
jgi:hypothetical protein